MLGTVHEFEASTTPCWVDSYAIGRAASFGAYDEADRGASSDAIRIMCVVPSLGTMFVWFCYRLSLALFD